MVISFIKKVKLIGVIWSCIPQVPFRTKTKLLFKPAESTRYTELSYILNYISEKISKQSLVLDISSPFILAYILSKNCKVIKTDISPAEKKFIKESKNLEFEIQNALDLTYEDNTFDFAYSISVVEHIYQGFQQAVNEIIRVVKPGGYIYISFPVSKTFQEEWLNTEIYSDQYKKDGDTFFQYRFDKETLNTFLDNLKNIVIVKKDIYWEKNNGDYNKMIAEIRKSKNINLWNFFISVLINFYYGFKLLNNYPEGFDKAKDFGNISVILKKIS